LDISSSSARIASTFSCSWIPFNSFFSWPPLLRSCGILAIPLPPKLFHWALILSFHPSPIPLYLLDCHEWNLEFFFNKLPTCTSKFFHQPYVEPNFL
jgi:hypothetical protein